MLRRSAFKPKSKYKPVELERFHGWVAAQGCVVCGWVDPVTGTATVHHVRGYADRPGGITKDDRLVAGLCPPHHFYQHDSRHSVEALGHQGFYQEWGVDLYAEAMRLAEQWQRRAA
jgi:hypothetical protein